MIARNNNPLVTLSNSEFLHRLETLVLKEKLTTLKILQYLIEMDRHRLYEQMGYGSLFDYCIRQLGYSESGANRRIKAARCIRDFPDVYEMLVKNELDLCKVSLISRTITEENKSKLLSEIQNRSYRQIEAILARYNPRYLLRDRIRPAYIKKPAEELAAISKFDTNAELKSDKKFTANVGGKKLASCHVLGEQKQILEKKFKLEFAVSPEVMSKIEQVKALLSTKFSKGIEFEQLFDILLSEYLDRHSPEQKNKRRQERAAKKKQSDSKIVASRKKSQQPAAPVYKIRSRHIPAAVQDAVYARDRGRCSYIGPSSVKCNSTWNLQINHIEPFAKGGGPVLNNLRLLCAKHNQLEAERIYGRDFINKKINNSRPHRE